MSDVDREILNAHRALFWDVKVENIDPEKNANYVIERFLEYGTLESVRWLRNRYGDDRLRKFIVQRGFKTLRNKTLNYWKIILQMENEPCLQPSSLAHSRRFWNY